MLDDPIETEQYLALNAYLCFCSAWGSFQGSMMAYGMINAYVDELFYMGFAWMVAGFILLQLADFKVPTMIWRMAVRHKWFN